MYRACNGWVEGLERKRGSMCVGCKWRMFRGWLKELKRVCRVCCLLKLYRGSIV